MVQAEWTPGQSQKEEFYLRSDHTELFFLKLTHIYSPHRSHRSLPSVATCVPRLTDCPSDLQLVAFVTDTVTVCGWSGEGCCAPAALSWLSTDFCSACLLWCRLSPSGGRSPSVWGFWWVQDVGMLLEGSERNRNSYSVLGFKWLEQKKHNNHLWDRKLQYRWWPREGGNSVQLRSSAVFNWFLTMNTIFNNSHKAHMILMI